MPSISVRPSKPKIIAQAATRAKASKPRMRKFPARDAEEIFRRLAEASPAPQTELAYHNPYTLLVAVVLSAQATDAGVNKATRALFAIADTPEKMASLGEERVREMIKSIGLYKTKAKNVIALSEILIRDHGGIVPRDRTSLEALPGVGRKTASVVLNVAFGEAAIAVDTHIFRVANRTGMAAGKTPLHVEQALLAVTPPSYLLNAHHWLILHGRYICKARTPDCPRCIIVDLCRFVPKTPASIGAKPNAAKRGADRP